MERGPSWHWDSCSSRREVDRRGRGRLGVVTVAVLLLAQQRRVQRNPFLCAHGLQRFGIGVCGFDLDRGTR
jgi:hypothetical protein